MKRIAIFFVAALGISSALFSGETKEAMSGDWPSSQAAASREAGFPRIFLRLAYGADLLKVRETVSWTQAVYQEDAVYSVNYDVGKGRSLSIGLGYRLSRHVGIELGYDSTSRDLAVENSASIPHPLYFDSPREAAVAETRKARGSAFSLDLIYGIPVGPFGLDLFGGPTYYSASAELTSAISFTESAYPYDSVSISPQSEKLNKGVLGFNAGAGLNLNLGRHLAVMMTARYLWARVSFLPSSGISPLDLSLGGLRLGGGLKILF